MDAPDVVGGVVQSNFSGLFGRRVLSAFQLSEAKFSVDTSVECCRKQLRQSTLVSSGEMIKDW